jgi:hypothetical protein
MWNYILLNIVCSIAIIVFIHQLWDYFKNTYTMKKTKNPLDFQTSKYKSMLDDALAAQNKPHQSPEILPEDKEWMVQELASYLASVPL